MIISINAEKASKSQTSTPDLNIKHRANQEHK